MKQAKQVILVIFLCSTTFMFSQDLNKLIENNGFRKIKLNTNVKNYVDDKGYYHFLKRDSTTVKYFERFTEYDYIYASKDYEKIGNVKIKYIFVKTLNEIIYDIFIVTEPNLEIFNLIQLAYGKPTSTYKEDSTQGASMAWNAEKLNCTLSGFKGHYYFQLHYYAKELKAKAWELEKTQLEKEQKEKTKKAIKEF
ncbi:MULTISPECIES: hypothetical protein [unclassified Maribacter]|uniref:hypothetical protein n=1 Tax=unclassified Maribacter TaxID=2615042 RepID=UPI00257F6CCC|nr:MULTISPECIES: hypothetical protein [unclassified Maribacter]|tara:strand:+ start:126268 stop:126852 length:585 start_codon:yes stop_codon:yes gene_type:complete